VSFLLCLDRQPLNILGHSVSTRDDVSLQSSQFTSHTRQPVRWDFSTAFWHFPTTAPIKKAHGFIACHCCLMYTVSHKKRSIKLFMITLSNLNRFSKKLALLKSEGNFLNKYFKNCTAPYLCCHTTLGNSKVQISLKLHKWTM